MRLQGFDGTVLRQWDLAVAAPRSTSREVLGVDLDGVDRTTAYLVVHGTRVGNRELLAAYKDLRRDVPHVRATVTDDGVVLESDALALGVLVEGEHDDAWVDVHPGVPRSLRGTAATVVLETR